MLADEIALWDAHLLLGIGDGVADPLRRAAVFLQDRQDRIGGGRVDHVAEADPHVEDLVHLAVGDAGEALDEREDRMRLDQAVDLEADRGIDPREVQQAVAGDVDERLDARDRLQNLHRLGT